MAELKFLKGLRENFSVASANSNYFYFVTNNDNTIDMYLGGVLLAKSADVADIQSLIDAIEVLNGDGEGSVKKAVADAIADVIANADEEFDTLKEIADYIVSDPYGSAELKNRVTSAETAISNAEGEIDALQGKMADVESKAHIHLNMDLLNEISEDKVNSWDAAEQNAKDYADAEIAKISIPSVEGLASEEWVNQQGFLKEHQSLAGYATEQWVEGKGYLTEHQSLAEYAKKSELPSVAGLASEEWVNQQGFLKEHQSLAEYAKKSELPTKTSELVNDSNFLTEHQSLAEYAKKSELPSVEGLASEAWVGQQGFLKAVPAEYVNETELANELASYATQSWVEGKGYLTQHQSLADYALKSELPSVEGLASEQWVNQQGFLKEHQSLADYALKSELPSVEGLASEQWVNQQGFLKEHQSLEDYALKADLNAEIEQRKALSGAEDSNIEVTIDADGKQIINLVWGEF